MKKIFILITILFSFLLINAQETLTFWHVFQGPLQKALVNVVNEYNNSQKNVTVELKYGGNYKNILTKMQGLKSFKGVLPDIFIGYSSWIEKLGENNFYQANEIVSKAILDKINPVMLKDATYNNKQYGLPFNKSILLMYVNTDIMDKIGINVENYKAKDFYKLLKDVYNKTHKPAMAYNLGTWFFESLFINLGGELDHINSATAIDALNAILKSYQKKYLIIKSGYSFQDYWTNEDVPIIFTSIVSLSYMKNKINFHYKRYNFLPNSDGKTKTIISGANLLFTKNSKNKKALQEFINWLYSHNNLEKWFQQSGYLPIYENFKEGKYLKNAELCLEPKNKNWYDTRRKLSGLLKKAVIYNTIPNDFFKSINQ